MFISCLMISHNKPDYVFDAINSVLNQEHQEWELLLMDSGILYDQGFFSSISDPRIKIIRSLETEETRKTKSIAPWCFNQLLKMCSGELIVYLCDDDIFYSNAFSCYSRWGTNNPKIMAMYASIDLSIMKSGDPVLFGERRALCIGGHGAYPMDCHVDYLQLCHRRSLLKEFDTEEYWPEDRRFERHADGVFMEKIGKICYLYPIPVKIGQNRRTPISNFYPSPTDPLPFVKVCSNASKD